MATVTLEERQRINHQLKTLGFGGIEDANLFAQMACLYRTHNSFRGLLMSTRPSERRLCYEALRPHLCFVPKPLDVYEQEVKERAEREQWDTWNSATQYPERFKVGEVESPEYRLEKLATEALAQNAHEKLGGLELVCTRCTVAQVFRAKLRTEAEKASREAGWRSDGLKSYCPKHVPGRCTMTIACGVCEIEAKIRCWEPADGYVQARLAGWIIEDDAKCPKCAVRKLILQ